MARACLTVIETLRNTVAKLEKSSTYQWGHMGSCNCGFLAQEITHLKKEDIHGKAMRHHGDWNEQLNDYCQSTGLPLDDIIGEMLLAGFDIEDLKHLEKLSDPEILQALRAEGRTMRHNVKSDVIKYLLTWAELLEGRLIESVQLPSFTQDVTESAGIKYNP